MRASDASRGRALGILAVLVVGLSLLSSAPPAGAASLGAPVRTWLPPFPGSVFTYANRNASSGCGGTGGLSWTPVYSAGKVSFNQSASILVCNGSTHASDRDSLLIVVDGPPFVVASNGTYNITARWTVTAWFGVAYSFGGAGSGTLSTGYLVRAGRPFVVPGSSAGACTGSGPSARASVANGNGTGSGNIWLNTTTHTIGVALTAGVSYRVATCLHFVVYASESGAPTGSTVRGTLHVSGPGPGGASEAKLVRLRLLQ